FLVRDLTLVTGAVDLGRDGLPAQFARPFRFYRDHLDTLLGLDVPMDRATLEQNPWFTPIQHIRDDPAWRSQATWLAGSPQAALAHYNPLVMSKLPWLAAQARANPFGTRYFAWIDSGITHTV